MQNEKKLSGLYLEGISTGYSHNIYSHLGVDELKWQRMRPDERKKLINPQV